MSDIPDDLSLHELRSHNIERCSKYFPGNHMETWSANDWMVALTGEVGELANVLKKLKRGYDLTRGLDEVHLRAECAKELGDIQCYLDLLAAKLGVSLATATKDKFNEVSKRVGYPFTLGP